MHAPLYVMAASGRDLKISGLYEPLLTDRLYRCVSIVTVVAATEVIDVFTLSMYVFWYRMLNGIL